MNKSVLQKSAQPTFTGEMMAAMKDGPRLYFAPLFAAIRAVRTEVRRINAELKRR